MTVPPAGGDVVEMARVLIRLPSPNPGGDERAVAGALTEPAADAGLPAPTVLERSSSRPNLLFTRGFGPGGRHLVLCGHMDTRPIGDADRSVDPLGAEIPGDRLYGLGSADMKGAPAAMVLAARNLARDGALRSSRLSPLFTADEEDGAYHGAQYLAEGVLIASLLTGDDLATAVDKAAWAGAFRHTLPGDACTIRPSDPDHRSAPTRRIQR